MSDVRFWNGRFRLNVEVWAQAVVQRHVRADVRFRVLLPWKLSDRNRPSSWRGAFPERTAGFRIALNLSERPLLGRKLSLCPTRIPCNPAARAGIKLW